MFSAKEVLRSPTHLHPLGEEPRGKAAHHSSAPASSLCVLWINLQTKEAHDRSGAGTELQCQENQKGGVGDCPRPRGGGHLLERLNSEGGNRRT